jgi:protein gp37
MPELWSEKDHRDQHGFRFFGDKHWAQPLKWAATAPAKLGHRPRVFCASMADVFEERAELASPRERLFALIEATPELDWLLLTKRPEVVVGMLDALDISLPTNVWLGVSIENSRFTWRADVLRGIPAAVRFISAEPLLGSLTNVTRPVYPVDADPAGPDINRHPLKLAGIDWVIAGGESGPRSRRTDPLWIGELLDATIDQCGNRDTAVFVKQLGKVLGRELGCADQKGGVIDEWPEWLRVREFPESRGARLAVEAAGTGADGLRRAS